MKVFIVSGCVYIGIHGAFESMEQAQRAVEDHYKEVGMAISGWKGGADFADAQFEQPDGHSYVAIYGVEVGRFASTC